MNNLQPELLDYDVTPELKVFIRAELELLMSLDSPDGVPWNNLSLAKTISNSGDFAGSISDDTIARFRNLEHSQDTKKPALMVIAGFLLTSQFIAEKDLEHYAKPGYSRAAASVSELFPSGTEEISRDLAEALIGEYRLYRRYGHNRLLETVLVVASPNDGRSITISEKRSVFRIDDFEWIKDESKSLSLECYMRIPELIEISGGVCEWGFAGRGIGVVTEQLILFLVGGEEQISHTHLSVTDVSYGKSDRINGLKGVRAANWIKSVNGRADLSRPADPARSMLAKRFGKFKLYPQGSAVIEAPKFASDDEGAQDSGTSGGRLKLLGGGGRHMSEDERQILEAEGVELDIEFALAECANSTDRLCVAIVLMRADHAIKAVEDGADVNAMHPIYQLPVMHTAASFGMRGLVQAILEKGECDLTVRDRHNRLASTCADNNAKDFELRDELIMAQNIQFREKGIDPRRPNVPGYGSLKLS